MLVNIRKNDRNKRKPLISLKKIITKQYIILNEINRFQSKKIA